MGGGSGGGTSTTSSKQGLPKWELPYAQGLTSQAQGLYTGSGYPTTSTAGFTPDQLAAMGGVEGLTGQQQGISNAVQGANLGLATGQDPYLQAGMSDLSNIAGGGNAALNTAQGALGQIASGQNPYLNQAASLYGAIGSGQDPYMQQAAGAYGGIASGQNPYMQAVQQGSQGLMNNQYVNAAQQANAAIAGGANLNAASNPALQSYLNAGMDPIIRNYQQAIAPNILSNAVASGGLGSSGTAQAFSNAQNQLASQLGNYAASVIEPAYEQGLSQQEQAIQNTTGLLAPQEQGLQNLQNLAGLQQGGASGLTGLAGLQQSGASGLTGIAGQQAGAASALPGTVNPEISAAGALPGMFQPQESAISQSPYLQQAAYGPTGQLLGIGGQQQQQAQNVLNTLFQNQMTPYTMLGQGANLIGQLSGGGGQSFTVGTTPGGSAK